MTTQQKDHTRPTTGPTEREARKVAEAARQTEWTKPSFGKELFLGRLRLDLVDPWPTPSPDARAKGEAFLARAARGGRPHRRRRDRARGPHPRRGVRRAWPTSAPSA